MRVEIDASLVDVPTGGPPGPSFHLGIVRPPLPQAVGGRREPADDPRNLAKGHPDGCLIRWDGRKMRCEPVVLAHDSIVALSARLIVGGAARPQRLGGRGQSGSSSIRSFGG